MPLRLAACIVFSLAASLAHAQWPSKPIKMVVPFPAGGPTDVITRSLADKLATALGVPVVVDNKPGAGGSIGSDFAAKSAPDGYTLLMATGSTHSVGPYLQKLPYDPVRDFVPIVYVGYATNIMLISPKVPAKTVAEFIALAKKEPGKYNYSSSGVGSVAHLTSEMFAAQAGIKLTHVPYKGTQLSIPDLVQGNVAILFDNVMTSKPHVESGRLNALGISSLQRSDVVPGIPTIDESGLKGFDSWNYFGIFGPAGTPRAVTERINNEMNRILGDPVIKERFRTFGFEIKGGTPGEFAAVIAEESAKWSKVIRDANVKAE
ncbi:MAG: tripartite tricarboxylate transporter substrate binding protein [Usitatibacter sp.]